jgi:hypothetical protein
MKTRRIKKRLPHVPRTPEQTRAVHERIVAQQEAYRRMRESQGLNVRGFRSAKSKD